MGLIGTLRELLSDGQWHALPVMELLARDYILPEVAIRKARYSRPQNDVRAALENGYHDKVLHCIRTIERQGTQIEKRAENDAMWYRIKPPEAGEYYQIMPPLSKEDYAALKKSIEEEGVKIPIELDEQGHIIDGYHRVKACQELGITDWPRLIRVGWSEEKKRLHARNLNLARRHLTTQQKRALVEAQLKETPEKSDRQIAKGLGVDHKTVGAARAELEAQGEIEEVEITRGADGKVRPRDTQTCIEEEPDSTGVIELGKFPSSATPVTLSHPKPAPSAPLPDTLDSEYDAIREEARAALAAVRRKYGGIVELETVWLAIDAVLVPLAEKIPY